MRRRRRSHAHRAGVISLRLPGAQGLVWLAVGVVVGTLILGTALGSSPPGARSSTVGSSASVGPTTAVIGAGPTPTTAPSSDPTVQPSASSSTEPAPSASASPASPVPPAGPFPGALLIADRGNGRLLAVTSAGRVVWSFPVAGSLPRGQQFAADDAFVAPDGKTIMANDEAHQVIDRIDIATRRIIWQYGHYDRLGGGSGFLHTPDDAYPLANGNVMIADIRNCRILEIAPSKRVVRQWGRTGVCVHDPPHTFAMPNGDTPLPDGGLLITEITGSRVVRLGPDGRVRFDIHVPAAYPSDAQLEPDGSVLVVDYSQPGSILRVSPAGKVLWHFRFGTGIRALDRPSLAIPLPNGMIALNDDFRDRVIVVDPRTRRIVWQYGRTDRPGRTGGRLLVPDGINLAAAGVFPGT